MEKETKVEAEVEAVEEPAKSKKKLYPNQLPKPYMIGRNVVAKESVKLYEWLKKMERLNSWPY